MLGEVAILLAWVPLLTRGRLLHCPLPVSVQPSGTPLEHVPITGDPEISCVGILNLHHPGDLCMTQLLYCLNEQSPVLLKLRKKMDQGPKYCLHVQEVYVFSYPRGLSFSLYWIASPDSTPACL